MKGLSKLLTTGVFLFSLTANAQVTIDDTHINIPGASLERYVDTSGIINAGNTGSGQNWTFNFNKDEANGLSFLNPASLPRSANFPTSNLALTFDEDNDSSWVFLEISDTSFFVLGFSEIYLIDGVIDTMSQTFISKILSFPSSINTNFNYINVEELSERFGADPDGTGPHPFVDSLKTTFTLRGESEIDAEGVLNIETCTYDALRQFYTEYTTDSVSMYANGSWQALSTTMVNFLGSQATNNDTLHLLRWWVNQKAIGFPIVECEADINKNPFGQIEWVSSPCVGIKELNASSISLYPNPANNEVSILTSKENYANHTFELFDLNGKMILSKNLGNGNIELTSVVSGTYMYQITDINNNVLSTDKLIIIK